MKVMAKLASLLWVLASVYAQDQPYCNARYERLCQGKGPHVACQFPYRGVGENCENYTSIIFSNNLKKFVLHYINRRRQRIAAGHERVRGGARLPKPELMMMVQWDRELAFLAQRLADQCQFVHDDCRATVRYPYAGQTVGEVRWRRSGSLENGARRVVARVFDAWWGERRRVEPKQLISPFLLTSRGAVWGHFSQLTVWTLRAMGCGAVHHGSTRPRLLLVCDFSHTNMLGQRTISPGPLAACPVHTVRIPQSPYPLLCAPVRNLQSIKDYGHHHEEYDDEKEEYDDEDEQQEQPEPNKKRLQTVEQDPVYSTRLWPDRPVIPLHEIPTEHNIPSRVLDDSDKDKSLKNNHDLIYRKNNANKNYGQINMESPIEGLDDQKSDMVSSMSQKFGLKEGVEDDGHIIRNDQYFVEKNIDQKTYKQKSKHKLDSDDLKQNSDDTNTQIINNERYDSIDRTQNDPQRSQADSDRNSRIKGIYKQEEFKRTKIKPILEQKTGSLKSDGYDQTFIKSLQEEVIDADRRPVKPIKDFFINPNRPTVPLGKDEEEEEEDIESDDDPEKEQIQTWRTDTEKTMVSVKYRDEAVITGEVRKSLDRELGLQLKYRSKEDRNRDTDTRNRGAVVVYRNPNIRKQEIKAKVKGPSIRYRDQENRNRHTDARNRDSDTRYRQYEVKNKAVHKIDNYQKFENIRKAEYKARNGRVNVDMSDRMLKQWRDERVREEENQKVLPLRKHGTPREEVTTVVVYRPTSLFSISTEPIMRSRFKQTRVRPYRPGANALLHSTNPNLYIRRQSKVSLLLDKDDEEQLYHDTGFKLSTVK